MRGCDLADSAGEAAYNERVGAGAIAKVAHAMEQLTIGDACRREEDVFRRNKVVHGKDLVEVVTSFASAAEFIFIAGVELALDLAAHGAQGAGSDHTFGSAADAEQHIHTGVGQAVIRAAATSPSGMIRMRAPARRISAIMSL